MTSEEDDEVKKATTKTDPASKNAAKTKPNWIGLRLPPELEVLIDEEIKKRESYNKTKKGIDEPVSTLRQAIILEWLSEHKKTPFTMPRVGKPKSETSVSPK